MASLSIAHAHATKHVDIYVRCTTGNDFNDGLSDAAAVKTLKRAMDIMNATTAGAYIHFKEPGEYNLSYPVISGAMIHFLFETSNVTMYWLDAKDKNWSKCFYACYINIHGNPDGTSIFHIRGSKPAYLEAGKMTVSNITWEDDGACAFGIIGGALQSASNIYKTHLYAGLSQLMFSNDVFETTSKYSTSAIHAYNSSTITFRNKTTFKNIDDNPSIKYLLSMTAATIFFANAAKGISFINTTTNRAYCRMCSMIGYNSRLTSWLSNCDTAGCTINGTYYETLTNYKGGN